MPQNNLYPFDPTGALPSNKIVGEQQLLMASSTRDYHFIVPKLGPYFADSLIISYRSLTNEVRQLVAGIDFYPTHWFISASRACGKSINGSISFLNLQLVGTVSLTYQTLGGDWVIDNTLIATILGDQLHNPRITAWDEVAELPYAFPPIDHQWDLADMVGMSSVVEKIAGVEQAIRESASVSTYTKPEVDALIQQAIANTLVAARTEFVPVDREMTEDIAYFYAGQAK